MSSSAASFADDDNDTFLSSPGLVRDHLKGKAKERFGQISGIVKTSTEVIRKSSGIPDYEDKATDTFLSPGLVRDHLKEKAKEGLGQISGIVKTSTEVIKKGTGDAADKVHMLKDKAVSKVLGVKSPEASSPSQVELHDPDEPDDYNEGKGDEARLPLQEFLVDFSKYFATGLLVYLVGYLQWTFLVVLFPIVASVLRDRQIEARHQQVRFQRAVITLGEEKAVTQAMRLLGLDPPLPSAFPETDRAEWVNNILAALWPNLAAFAERLLKEQVEPLLYEQLWGLSFGLVDLGDFAPRINGIKVHRCKSGMVLMDVDLDYRGDLSIAVSLLKAEASVRDVRFSGRLRISVETALGRVQISMERPPALDFDLGGVANVLDMPGLRGKMHDAVLDQISDVLVLPNRIRLAAPFLLQLSTETASSPSELAYSPRPAGVLVIEVVEARDLIDTDGRFGSIDPFVVIRGRRTSVASGGSPRWNKTAENVFEFVLEEAEIDSEIDVVVFDKDTLSSDDFIGRTAVSAKMIVGTEDDHDGNGEGEVAGEPRAVDRWLSLQGVESGQLRLKMYWMPATSNKEDYLVSANASWRSRAVLTVTVESCVCPPLDDEEEEEEEEEDPDIRVCVHVSGEASKTVAATNTVQGRNPVFQEGFTFLIGRGGGGGEKGCSLEGRELKLRVEDVGNRNKVLGEHRHRLAWLTESEDLRSKMGKFHLDRGGSITYSARLQFLKHPPPPGEAAKSGKSGLVSMLIPRKRSIWTPPSLSSSVGLKRVGLLETNLDDLSS